MCTVGAANFSLAGAQALLLYQAEQSVLTTESPYARISECEGNFYKAAFLPKPRLKGH